MDSSDLNPSSYSFGKYINEIAAKKRATHDNFYQRSVMKKTRVIGKS